MLNSTQLGEAYQKSAGRPPENPTKEPECGAYLTIPDLLGAQFTHGRCNLKTFGHKSFLTHRLRAVTLL